MDLLKRYLRPLLRRILVGLSLKSLAALAALFLPYLLAYIIDKVVPLKDVTMIWYFGGLMIMISIGGWISEIIANRMASRVARDAIVDIRHDLFTKSIYLSCAQMDKVTISSLESRLTSDTYHVHRMIGMMQRMGVKAPILLIGGILMTFFMEPYLALIMMATLPFITYLVYIKATKGISLYTLVQKAQDKMIAVVRENTQGMRIIKALARSDYEKDHYEQVNKAQMNAEKTVSNKMAIINPMMSLLMNVGLVLVIVAGAYRVNGGISETGKIIAFTNYFTLITNAMMAVSRMFVMYSKGIASAERIESIMQMSEDLKIIDKDDHSNDHVVEFDNVSFSYLKKKNNISNISFKLDAGETLGIIGATGSGKSTIMQLLLRFYDVDQGVIRIYGQDIRSYQPKELRDNFGIVMQNDFIFQDTIKENIEFGRIVDDNMIEQAAFSAQANAFIDELDDKFEHKLNSKGTNLSGGQRQRILLSRAFVSEPNILLLDDSSSALDYATDARLRKAINQKFKNTTKIIIAQRVSSIKHADQIIVLDEGKIVACGKHQDLLNESSIYAQISESQMGGALLD
ncbi:MAG: ABC transporter ATP-binding protein [Erysipelotrichaceae bacterium]|nr:ABC transporter ATP-binding protein [Erysipelotrichaceae bacterium]MDD3923906.1 ABC transporter ATP-binding protein [Erysipelotrichaceae bacterium]MDD4642118.1 ABC transporter ATP-binding protein [Erysipelotrichaceae bacterium]